MKAISISILTLFIFSGCSEDTTGHIPTPVPDLAENAPAWSHAGDKIAFFSWSDSLGVFAPGIYISDTMGNSRKPTGVAAFFVKWLPGDTELVISTGVAGPGDFIIFNLNSGEVKTLAIMSSLPPFDISKDGQFIYYEGPAIDTFWSTGIYRYKISDSSILAISDGVTPAISLDGTALAYAQRGICTRIIADSTEKCFPPLERSPSWPIWVDSGNRIVYHNGRGSLHVTDLLGTDRFLVSGNGPLSLSPDGLSILFSRAADDFKIHIWRMNIDGTSLRQVTR